MSTLVVGPIEYIRTEVSEISEMDKEISAHIARDDYGPGASRTNAEELERRTVHRNWECTGVLDMKTCRKRHEGVSGSCTFTGAEPIMRQVQRQCTRKPPGKNQKL